MAKFVRDHRFATHSQGHAELSSDLTITIRQQRKVQLVSGLKQAMSLDHVAADPDDLDVEVT